jgi:EH domain-containing protein 1
MHNSGALGKEKRTRDGQIVAKLGTEAGDDFAGLSKFGDKFLSSFQVSFTDNKELEDLIIVDTPGIMPGQADSRGYDFLKICRWFATRSDMVVILFDAHKLVIEEDFLNVIENVVEAVRGNQKKIRLVLNKVDDVATEDLLNVYGQLMWVLATSGKILLNQVEVRVFVTAFDPRQGSSYDPIKSRAEKDEHDLLKEIAELPTHKAQRKISDLLSHLEILQAHMRVISELRNVNSSFRILYH